MKNIFHIFKTDIMNIGKNKAAIVVIAAVMFLPSLYAWFNIIPSWDPYANTEGVAVAVANLDEGATFEGKDLNVGDEIVLSLIENKKLGWQFVSEDEAMKGVEHGDYYASIIIPKDFSEKLTSVLTDEVEKPELDYYINEKISAVAPKVTGAGASGIVDSISDGFVKVANEAIFTAFDKVGIELEEKRPSIEQVRDSIFRLEEDLPEIERIMGVAKTDLGVVEDAVGKAKNGVERASEIGKQAEQLSAELDQKLTDGDKAIRKYVPIVQQDLKIAQKVVQQIPDISDKIASKGADVDRLVDKVEQGAAGIADGSESLQKLSDLLQESDQKLREERKLDDLVQRLVDDQERLGQLKQTVDKGIATLEKGDHLGVDAVDKMGELTSKLTNRLNSFDESYNKMIVPRIQEDIEKIRNTAPRVKKTVQDLQNSTQSAIEVVQQIQNVDLPIDSDRLKSVQSKVDASRMRVDDLLGLFNRVNEMTGSGLLAGPIDSLTQVQSRLDSVSELLTQTIRVIERGENPETSVLAKIEKRLQEADRFLGDVANAYDTKITDAFNNAIMKMTELDKTLRTEVDKLKKTAENVAELHDSLDKLVKDPQRTLSLLRNVSNRMEQGQQTLESIGGLVGRLQSWVDAGALADHLQRIEQVQDDLRLMSQTLTETAEKVRAGKENRQALLANIKDTAVKMDQSIAELLVFIEDDLMPKYEETSAKAKQALKDADRVLAKASAALPRVNELLAKAEEGVGMGKEGLALADEYFPEVKQKIIELAKNIRSLEEKGDLDQLIDLMKNNPDQMSEFFADPLLLNEHELYPMPNYGSAMSPFFTTMSLWVGALILVSSLIVDIENKHVYKSYEAYFGRFLTFWMIGLMQALIVTMGDLFLLKTFVAHKLLFVLFGLLISTTFVLIVYTLVSVFGNTGKVLGIILLVMQLGASGGTFPIQMTPVFFQKIHAFLPFTHALRLLREAAGGVIWGVVWKHILFLLIYMGIALVVGVGLKKRINKSSDKFLSEARRSKIVM